MHQVASIGILYASNCFQRSTICINLLPLEHYKHKLLPLEYYKHQLLLLDHYVYQVASIGALSVSSCFHWSTMCIKLLPLEH